MDTSADYMIIMPARKIREIEKILRAFKTRTKQEAVFLQIERGADIRFL